MLEYKFYIFYLKEFVRLDFYGCYLSFFESLVKVFLMFFFYVCESNY